MALAADVHVEIFTQGRTGFKGVATAAINSHVDIIGMNFWFHDDCLVVFCAATRAFVEHRTTVGNRAEFKERGYYQNQYITQGGKNNQFSTLPSTTQKAHPNDS